jgi:subtilase family serine protease
MKMPLSRLAAQPFAVKPFAVQPFAVQLLALLSLGALPIAALSVGVQLAAAQSVAQATTQSALAPRISATIDDSARVTLPGSRSPRALAANDVGALADDTRLSGITLVFALSAAQQADLDQLLVAQQDPASPQYHQWLTPAQFGARFGLADSDIAKVQAWLMQHGFSLDSVSNSRTRISFSGTAAQVASAFGTSLHNFSSPDGTHFAPAADLTLPAAFAGNVLSVDNLTSFHPRSHVVLPATPAVYRPNFTSSQTGNHYIQPGDLATIYDINAAYNLGYTGSGQTIAIVGQSAVVGSDITNFQSAAGLSAKLPSLVLVPGSGTSTVNPQGDGDEVESDLDIEYSGAIAKGAAIVFVYTGSNTNYSVSNSLIYAVDNDIAQIVTSSYGNCEAAFSVGNLSSINAALQQGASQGETFLSASGDSGSTDCYGVYTASNDGSNYVADNEKLAVDFPGSSQYAVSVGGTEFTPAAVATGNNTYFAAQGTTDVVASALSYVPEQAWNDDSSSNGIGSGGGGVSSVYLAPSWQTGTIGGVAFPSNTYRQVPDVALDASPVEAALLYCSSDSTYNGVTGSCTNGFRAANGSSLTTAGGTSFAAPIFAGMVAIINQAKGYKAGQGLITPTLYSLAGNATTYGQAFHDITLGGNQCLAGTSFCSSVGASNYAAVTGYDDATGLGSVDLNKLLTAWPANSASTTKTFTVAASNTTITQASSTSGSSTVTITPTGGYTGTVHFIVSSTATVTNVCYSIANASVTGTSAVTATLNIYAATATCASGTYALVKSSSTGQAALRAPAAPASQHRNWPAPVSAALLGFVLLAGLARRSRKVPATLALSLLALLSVAGMGLSGCSSGAAASTATVGGTTTTTTSTATTPTGAYTITVTAADTTTPTLAASTTFTLTVQ